MSPSLSVGTSKSGDKLKVRLPDDEISSNDESVPDNEKNISSPSSSTASMLPTLNSFSLIESEVRSEIITGRVFGLISLTSIF